MNPPQRFYLITYPRTASNLLIKMLSLDEQPGMTTGDDRGGYIFLPVNKLMNRMGVRNKKITHWTEEELKRVKDLYQRCFDQLQQSLANALENDHSVYIKEHIHFLIDPPKLSEYLFGPENQDVVQNRWILQLQPPFLSERGIQSSIDSVNVTLLPDAFLQTWKPTFLIRHPALAFPSLYRALLKSEHLRNQNKDLMLGQHCMTLRWTRMLYDWYVQYYARDATSDAGAGSQWPIVLDADDIMSNPKLVEKYCLCLGMDPRKLLFSWRQATDEELSHMDSTTKRYLGTLLDSDGIRTDKIAGDIDINKQADTWRMEFGTRAGETMRQLVNNAMPDYEFLRANRLMS
ncbi:hypothetical protein NLG97_g7968 [Lecanicillium saksenae]|uniref:Uncharacterized protein n=1 Tax=Lecanicillium saksenae TaxID=468837 RepID=A0ACC1QMM8_9HYPO|nr:hypothetical protein NLG97_g7968 [Lecanicillium saksenae]